jgi:hypothetical protein
MIALPHMRIPAAEADDGEADLAVMRQQPGAGKPFAPGAPLSAGSGDAGNPPISSARDMRPWR